MIRVAGAGHGAAHAAPASSTTSRSTPRCSPTRADRRLVRVMISCGEPSGDLYAGALATEILPRRSLPRRSPGSAASACATPARRWSITSAASRSPACSRSRACCRAPTRIYRRLVRHAARAASGRVRRDRLSRLQLPSRARDAAARRPGRLLHQPAAVGLAARADEDDAADRRSRAGDLPVREAIYERAGVPVEWVGHPLLDVMPPPEPRRRVPRAARAVAPAAGRRAPAGQPRATRCGRSCPAWSRRRRLDSAGGSRTCSSWSRGRRTSTTTLFAPLARADVGAGRDRRRRRPTRCSRRPTSRWSRPAP